MSKTIDKRIVEMQFNNKQFESGIKTSLSSIEKLKQGLNFKDSAKGLAELQNAGKSFSLSKISESVEYVAGKFSNLGIIGVTALQNITNSAIEAGKSIVSAFTIDPIKTGFQEYETQINAIQTVLANTSHQGTTLDDVNKALDELNVYADKTIYNFTEMTKNIGTFTAAGVDLETSVKAIKGIANLAAISGSNSEQASRAMYQLSQAIAAGKVNLQDWNSVVNAGMGGKVFQDALVRTGKLMGADINASQSFRESISAKDGTDWLTADILLATLEQFTGDMTEAELKAKGFTDEQTKSIIAMGKTANAVATEVKTFTQLMDTMKESVQSGWTQTWEILIGDFDQAKSLLTSISNFFGDIINKSAESRNNTLESWASMGGRDNLLEGLKNTFEGILSVIKPIQDAFREIFPPATATQLSNISKTFKELSENFKLSDETANKLKSTFKGIFSLFDIGGKAVSALAGGFFDLFQYILPSAGGLLDITAALGDYITGVNESIDKTNIFGKAIDGVVNVLKGIGDKIKSFGSLVSGLFSDLDGLSGRISSMLKPVKSFFDTIQGGFSSFSGNMSNPFSSFNLGSLFTLLSGGLLISAISKLKEFFSSLKEIAEGGGILDSFKEILGGVQETLESFQNSLKSDTLIKIAAALGILTVSILSLASVDPIKLTSALTAMAVMIGELFAALSMFEKAASGAGFKGIGKVAFALLTLSTSVLILTGAVKALSSLNWDELVKGLEGVGGLMVMLTISAKSLSKSSGQMMKGSLGLISFSVAINILANAVKSLGELNVESLTKGLIGVGVLCAELVLFMNNTKLDSMGMTKGMGLMFLATSILILSKSVEQFSKMDGEGIVKGLGSVLVILAELSLFINTTGDAKKVISTSIGMTILGGAMLIFAEAVTRMGELSWESIAKGIITMASSLSIISVALKLMPKNMISSGLGLVAIATSMVILSNALGSMSGMSWEGVAKSLVALAGALGILAIATNAMSGAIGGAAAIMVVSAALLMLAPVIKTLGSMSFAEVATSLIVLAGSFAVIGGAAALLTPIIPAMLGLTGALALLGVASLGVGVGISALAIGLTTLAASGAAGVAALTAVITGLLGLIPLVLEQIGLGIVAFAKVISDGAPAIAEAVIAVGTAIIQTIGELTPMLVTTVITLLTTLLQTLADNMPQMVDAGFRILLSILQGIRDNIQEIVVVSVQIITEFVNGISSQLPVITQAGFDLIISFIDSLSMAIEQNTGRLVESILGLGGAMIQGLIDGLMSGVTSVVDTIKNIGTSALDGLKEVLGIHSPSREFESAGEYSVQGYINGMTTSTSLISSTSANMGTVALAAINAMNPQFTEAGKNNIVYLISGFNQMLPQAQTSIITIMERILYEIQTKNPNFVIEGKKLINSLLNGIRDMETESASVARSLVEKIVGEVSSRSNALYEAGRNLAASLADGLRAGIDDVRRAAQELADAAGSINSGPSYGGGNDDNEESGGGSYGERSSAYKNLQKSMAAFSTAFQNGIDSEPTIRPVMDLSEIEKDSTKLNEMLNSNRTLDLTRSISNTAMTARSMKRTSELTTSEPEHNSTNPASIQFVQNNYSPKALSRIDIYRQTKNQISQMKEKVVMK